MRVSTIYTPPPKRPKMISTIIARESNLASKPYICATPGQRTMLYISINVCERGKLGNNSAINYGMSTRDMIKQCVHVDTQPLYF